MIETDTVCWKSRVKRRMRYPFVFDHVRSLLCDHDGRCICVSRNDVGHYGRVDHPEAQNTVHTQSGVHHGAWVCRRSHLARPHGMVDCHSVVSCRACPVLVWQELEVLAAWNLVLVNSGRQALHSSGLAHREPELGPFNLQQETSQWDWLVRGSLYSVFNLTL